MAEGMNTVTTQLPTSVTDQILGLMQEGSAVMQLATPMALPTNGATVPVITGEPAASWAAETDERAVNQHTLATKQMKALTLSVIEPFSNQFRDNYEALYTELVNRLPMALAKKFDETVLYEDAPAAGFETLKNAAHTTAAKPVYDGLLECMTKVNEAGSYTTGFVMSERARIALLSAKDKQDRPLFVTADANSPIAGTLLGVPATFTHSAYQAPSGKNSNKTLLGVGGNFAASRYGIAQDVTISVSDQATLNVGGSKSLNLWQRGMFAVRCDIQVGFVIRDIKDFAIIEG